MHASRHGMAAAVAVVFLAAGCAVTLLAQATDIGAGSLKELTAEIRELRFSIEQSTRSQTQAQALGIFLSAQDRRVMQVTARLESARREIIGLSQQASTYAHELAQIQEDLPLTPDPEERKVLEQRIKDIALETKAVAGREQEARAREAEMAQAWQQEDARWNDLIARLQQIVDR